MPGRLPAMQAEVAAGRMNSELPIDALRETALDALSKGPLVLAAPTGSGKSTQLPRWCSQLGKVLVVEPRRVACRALAARVASLEQTELGRDVGYVVRGERNISGATRILFVTTGVALRMASEQRLDAYTTVILDEFHERSLEIDLLLALLLAHPPQHLVITSATLEAERVAQHIGGRALIGTGRSFPVEISYTDGAAQPDPTGLLQRLDRALEDLAEENGDILVFLPGKSDISRVTEHLTRRGEEVLPLHGQLSLMEQSRCFEPSSRRRIIASTNVAETSLTLPHVTAVIDSGLVRREVYHRGRGYLTLVPISMDSAAQRAGRAGRVRAGRCIRLWSSRAKLDHVTPPAIERESLSSLVLGAAACGHGDLSLPFLDPPRDYAVSDAQEDLRVLGALDGTTLTERGRAIFALPIGPHLGRFLVEAEQTDCLEDAIDLVASLEVPRKLFLGRDAQDEEDLRHVGCDAVARIRALRTGVPREHRLDRFALATARRNAKHLRKAWGITARTHSLEVNRERLVQTLLAADPRAGHIIRRRKRHIAWSNGGTERDLTRDSAIDTGKVEALVALQYRALGSKRERSLVITCAMPVPVQWLARAGLGRERLGPVDREGEVITATVERVLAGRTIGTRRVLPKGTMLREAISTLVASNRLFPRLHDEIRDRLERLSLQAQLEGGSPAPATAEDWLSTHLDELGVEDSGDLALLQREDLLPSALPADATRELERRFPRDLNLGDARYRLHYSPSKREVILEQIAGRRRQLPPVQFLPSLPGWRILVRDRNRTRILRDRR